MSWQSLHQVQQHVNPKGVVAVLTSSATTYKSYRSRCSSYIKYDKAFVSYLHLHFLWQAWDLFTSTFILCGRCGTFVHRLSFYVAGVGLYDMVETSQILIGGCFLCWFRFGTRFSSKVSRLSVNLMCVCVYVRVSMRCVILCSEVIQNGCVLK